MKIAVETKAAAAKDAEEKSQMKTVGFLECFMLGIGIAGGGISTSRWQVVLLSGVWEGLIATLLVIIGYFMLLFSLAELVGIVPFAGGHFGFVRCSLGPFLGFMTACMEIVLYLFYSVRTFQKLAQLVTAVALTSPDSEPLWVLCALISVGIFHLRGGSWFWGTMVGCTIFTLLVLAVFMVGSFMVFDFHTYALSNGTNNGFIDTTGESYMLYCHFPMLFFLGLCIMPLTSQRVKDAQVVVPKAMMSAATLMAIIAILALFCVASQAPGVGLRISAIPFILGNGLSTALDIPDRYIIVVLMVPTYASAIGFMFACKHQLASMAESGLAPTIFKKRYGPNKIPAFALLFVVILQFSLYLVVNHYLATNLGVTFLLYVAAACILYISLLSAFIAFKYKFEGMQRKFVSPVGIPGAILGICVFSYILVGVLFYHPDGSHAGPITLAMYMGLMFIYYFSYVQYVQFFSLEEQEKFMKAYILNANKKRKASKWVKMMNAMFVSTGLDKLFLRSTARKPKGRTTMSRASKSRSTDEASASHPAAVLSPSAVSLKNNKVGILTVDVAVYGDLCSASVDTVCTPTLAASRPATNKVNTTSKTGPLTWSGKVFGSDGESRKAFQLLHATAESNDDDENDTIQGSVNGDSEDVLGEQLIEAFPEHFVLPSEGIASVDTHDEYGTVGRSLLLTRNLQPLKAQARLPPSNAVDVEMGLLGLTNDHQSKEEAGVRPAETTSA